MCTWDEASNNFDQQIATRNWLRRLHGQAARIVVGALRDLPGSARYYYELELADKRTLDMAICNAVNQPTGN
ncbi:hypothetical protein [Streptomyces sp. NPDC045470]|uniref:hypothetical protein n=1 Tax=Streptomyces sp. NPDC045470 TaxID=3155469 RepID=UPI0033CE76AB